MVFGGVQHESVQLNEESLWSGGFRDRNNPEAGANLRQIRSLLKAGKIPQAEELACFSLSGLKSRIALTCFEHEASHCHRHVIRDYLKKIYNVKTMDL
jgi:hypothetical protein